MTHRRCLGCTCSICPNDGRAVLCSVPVALRQHPRSGADPQVRCASMGRELSPRASPAAIPSRTSLHPPPVSPRPSLVPPNAHALGRRHPDRRGGGVGARRSRLRDVLEADRLGLDRRARRASTAPCDDERAGAEDRESASSDAHHAGGRTGRHAARPSFEGSLRTLGGPELRREAPGLEERGSALDPGAVEPVRMRMLDRPHLRGGS